VIARKIKPDEYEELIKWNEYDVERVFHFLNGTEVSLYSAEENILLKKNSLHKFGFRIKILDKENYNISGYKNRESL